MKNEPIRHHYIPRFILRNFCFDLEEKLLYYYDRGKHELSKKRMQDVFMVRNLYRDNRTTR